MVRFRRTVHLAPAWQRREVRAFLLVTAATAAAYVSVLLFEARNAMTFTSTAFLPIHTALEIFTIAVSFSIFGVRWSARMYAKDAQSLFLGSAFLSVGLLHMAHTLTFQGMPSPLEPNVSRPLYFWTAARLTFAAALVAASFVPTRRPSRVIQPWPVLAFFVAFSAAVIVIFTWFADLFPPLLVPDRGLTELKVAIEYVIIAILLIALVRYWGLMSRTREMALAFLMSAIVLGVFEESIFTMYKSVYDLMVLLGHVFGFLSFSFVFLALFEVSVKTPYVRLARSLRRLTEKKRETAEVTTRAQTYLDFLSHDMANMITPMRSYAEMISADERVPPKIVKYSMGIVDQIDRAASSIVRMRKLSELAKDLVKGEASTVDIAEAFRRGKAAIEQRAPRRRLNLVLDSPARAQASFVGADIIEDVIVDLLDLGARHSIQDTLTVAARIREMGGNEKTPAWDVQVDFSRVHVPENLDLSPIEVSDSGEGLMRGVFSDASFVASVLKLVGGELRAEKPMGPEAIGTLRVVMRIPNPPAPAPPSEHEQDQPPAGGDAGRIA